MCRCRFFASPTGKRGMRVVGERFIPLLALRACGRSLPQLLPWFRMSRKSLLAVARPVAPSPPSAPPAMTQSPGSRVLAACLALVLSGAALAEEAQPTPEQIDFFEKKVRPILVENCHKCHGEKKQQGNLRLDSKAAM